MQHSRIKTTCAIALLSAGFVAAPVSAIQLAFTGGSNLGNLTTVTGDDTIGGTWQTHNDSDGENSHFAMADFLAAPQLFNTANFSNGLGNFINSFQLTLNNSQFGSGFRGINLDAASSGLENHFTAMVDPLDASTWTPWSVSYNLVDGTNGLFQQVLFTSPPGTRLDQGMYFTTNVNFAGIMTADSGWAASYEDRADLSVPEPASLALAFLGLAGIGAAARRKASQ